MGLTEEILARFAALEARLVAAEARAVEAEARAAAAEARAVAAEARVVELEAENAGLRDRVRELEARLKQDSSNSSKPPSSDVFRRGKLTAKKTGGKAGAQKGHKGATRMAVPPERVTERKDIRPSECGNCHRDLTGAQTYGRPDVRQVVDLPKIDPIVTEYVAHSLVCPDCRRVTRAKLPPEAAYGTGPQLTAWVAALVGRYRVSRQDTADLLTALLNVPICKGTVQACCERVSAALAEPVAELERALPDQPRVFLDETGWRERGARRWLWIARADRFACYAIHPRRGTAQLAAWFPRGYGGIVHSDRWSAYSFFDTLRRQFCWAHLLRDLQAVIDAGAKGVEAARSALQGAHGLFHTWHAFKRDEIARGALMAATRPFVDAFRTFCTRGSEQEKDRRWAALGRNLLKDWDAVFRFLDTEGVEPTNNDAEQGARGGVLWRRITQGTRSPAGSDFVARMLSATATCRIQERDLAAFLHDAFVAHLRGHHAPSLLHQPLQPG